MGKPEPAELKVRTMHLTLEREILKAINHPLKEDTCFVCGCSLNEQTRTREHVLPRWLQRKLTLADAQVVLLNGTHIPYRQITVPCCKDCNGQHLSQLEQTIRTAVESGCSAVQEVPDCLLYQWLAKIYIGLLYKELFLPQDRVTPKKGSILQPEELLNVRILWFWLRQSLIRADLREAPGSIWTFRCLVPPQSLGDPFDMHDFHHPPTFGIRMGEVGLIVDFLDCGLLRKQMWPVTCDLQRLRLSPEQFVEVFVRLSYKASTFGLHVNVSVGLTDDGDEVLRFLPKSTVPGEDDFMPWDEERYADLLAFHMGRDLPKVLLPDGRTRSWVYDGDGRQIKQYEYR